MPPWPWVILGRVPRLVAGDAEAAVDADAEEEHAADFSIPVALPPQVTVVAAAPSAHPEPDHPDMYPYILAVDRECLLFHFSAEPFHGVCFGEPPYESNLLIVARRFRTAGVQQGDAISATAERIPRHEGHLPVIFNIESIGLVSTNGPADYLIAKLMVDKGSEHARLLCFDDGSDHWYEQNPANSLAAADDREWVPSGVLAHEDKLWRFDLSWGILSLDPFAGADELTLLFHSLPEDRVLAMTGPDIHHHRCLTESSYVLRYVEIVIPEGGGGHDQGEAATVSMWTRISAPGGYETIGWDMEYEITFAEIWDDDRYKKTMLPRKVPVLAVVCPWSPHLVYFALEVERRLFSVNVPEHTVVQILEVLPWPAPPSRRFVVPWFLPLTVAEALGMDPFDNRGEIDEDDVQQAGETNDDEQQAEEIDSDDEQQSEIYDDEELSAAEIDSDGELQAGETDDDELPKSEVTDSGDDDAGEGAI